MIMINYYYYYYCHVTGFWTGVLWPSLPGFVVMLYTNLSCRALGAAAFLLCASVLGLVGANMENNQ